MNGRDRLFSKEYRVKIKGETQNGTHKLRARVNRRPAVLRIGFGSAGPGDSPRVRVYVIPGPRDLIVDVIQRGRGRARSGHVIIVPPPPPSIKARGFSSDAITPVKDIIKTFFFKQAILPSTRKLYTGSSTFCRPRQILLTLPMVNFSIRRRVWIQKDANRFLTINLCSYKTKRFE